MDETKWKHIFYFAVAINISILLVWFGSKLMLSASSSLNTPSLVISGGVFLIIALILASNPEFWKYWKWAVVFLLLGMYLIARAAGTISESWLSILIGAASWLAAAIIMYLAWPGRHKSF